MIFKIYDYDNSPKLIDLPVSEDEISCITVTVLSGDEVVEITTKNGDSFTFDSSESRLINFSDGEYFIDNPQTISSWLHWEPTEEEVKNHRTLSYLRQGKFSDFCMELLYNTYRKLRRGS